MLFACSITFAFDPYSSTDDAYSYRSNPYDQRFNPYPDGSSRPLNPGPGGRWNDDEYNSRQQTQPHRSEPSVEPGASPSSPTTDFNVWDKTGTPKLCTRTSHDVYCY